MLVKFCEQTIQGVPYIEKTAATSERKIVPIDTSMRYLRFRAIGNFEVSGPNGNSDGFPYEHFEDDRPGYGYKSFINKRAHVEHNSQLGLAGSIGDLPDAYLNKFIYPKEVVGSIGKNEVNWASLLPKAYADLRQQILEYPNQKDGAIEVLMRIDTNLVKSATLDNKTKYLLDRIIRMIDTGQKLTCSMGTNVGYSYCSTCGNKAQFASDYCDHLKKKKGGISIVSANDIRDLLDKEILRPEWLKWLVTSKFDRDEIIKGASNKGVAVKNIEINHELSFFELSIVAMPAFPEAKMIEKLGRKQDETRKEYLERIAEELGNDGILDLYSFLQERGLISSQCEVR